MALSQKYMNENPNQEEGIVRKTKIQANDENPGNIQGSSEDQQASLRSVVQKPLVRRPHNQPQQFG